MKIEGHTHAGRCSTETFTRQDAEMKLIEQGWTWNAEAAEWKRGDERARLGWFPDYCNPEDSSVGTFFFLRPPNGRLEMWPVLGEEKR